MAAGTQAARHLGQHRAQRVQRIEVGARANLVALDLDAEWMVREDGFRSLSANSWLLGETLRGRIVRTLADGREVFAA